MNFLYTYFITSNMDMNYVKSTHIHIFNGLELGGMPTVGADVAFGLGRVNLTNDETQVRVTKALSAVGMHDYLQVTDG